MSLFEQLNLRFEYIDLHLLLVDRLIEVGLARIPESVGEEDMDLVQFAIHAHDVLVHKVHQGVILDVCLGLIQ